MCGLPATGGVMPGQAMPCHDVPWPELWAAEEYHMLQQKLPCCGEGRNAELHAAVPLFIFLLFFGPSFHIPHCVPILRTSAQAAGKL